MRKSQKLVFIHGIPQVMDNIPPVEDMDEVMNTIKTINLERDPLVAPKVTEVDHYIGAEPAIPPQWLTYDRKVLRYYAYYLEPVTESNEENSRVRIVTIFFYLEDGTLHMIEPREDNSGLPQGEFLCRHQAELDDGSFVSIENLQVGQELSLYGKSYHLSGCDTFTRYFMSEQGFDMAPDTDAPLDQHRIKTMKAAEFLKKGTTGTYSVVPKVKDEQRQFLAYDRKVLRFYALWDDRENIYGDNQTFGVLYYLADDTISISNDPLACVYGRDPYPQLLRRSRLPKDHTIHSTYKTPLNVQYYHWEDMSIGTKLNVYGRDFLLYDCDEFTRSWLKAHGASLESLKPVDITDMVGRPLEVPAAPVKADWYGIGTERDQMQNVMRLIPKPGKPDWPKFRDYDGVVLRSIVKMVPQDGLGPVSAADDTRRPILSFFLADDTISLYEVPVRNSGIVGGKFLDRRRLARPENADKIYTVEDIKIGAHIYAVGRCFEILSMDAFTTQWLQENGHSISVSKEE